MRGGALGWDLYPSDLGITLTIRPNCFHMQDTALNWGPEVGGTSALEALKPSLNN